MKILQDRSTIILHEKVSEFAILQSQPTIRTLKFYGKTAGRQEKVMTMRLQLALPYVIFFVNHHNAVKVGFSNNPLESSSDLVYFPLLPSIDESFYACIGTYFKPCDWLSPVHFFWQDSFNMYGSLTCSRWPSTVLLRDTFLKSYVKWSDLTRQKKSPEFMLDFNELYKHIRIKPITVKQFCENPRKASFVIPVKLPKKFKP
jgi:hypothetical protein